MNITIVSAFRNATPYIDRYFEQMAGLRAALELRGDCLILIVGEGDSSDDSADALYAAIVAGHYEATLLDVTHGGPDHGSVVHPQRFKQLAYVWNEMWSAIPSDADAVVFLESDLIWQAPTIIALIDDLAHVTAVAPLVILQRKGYPQDYFYDVWAFRRNGEHFTNQSPYMPLTVKGHARMMDSGMEQIDSAGSCLVMRAEYARKTEWRADDLIVGLCRQIYEQGGAVYVDPSLKVVHP